MPVEKVTFGLLRSLFDRLGRSVYANIEYPVNDDYYWTIDLKQAFDIYTEPELMVGSLIDDTEQLLKLLDDPERPVSSVDFGRFGNLLRYLMKSMEQM